MQVLKFEWKSSFLLRRFYCSDVEPEFTAGIIRTKDWKEYDRKYRDRNKDKLKESKSSYYLRNLEIKREYASHKDPKWRDRDNGPRNKKKDREYVRQYLVRTKDQKRVYDRQYRLDNKDKARDYSRLKYLRNHGNPASYNPRHAALKSWRAPELVREYFESIAKQLQISDYTDWYRISRLQIYDLGGMLQLIELFSRLIS
jgi:hypothetical protein